MNLDRFRKYAPVVLRIGVALVFLWFGLNQMLNTDAWVGWAPAWASSLPISVSTLILLNGVAETVLGLLLLIGLYTRVAAFLLAVHLFGIALSLGYNDVAIRDYGLSIATFAVFLQGPDAWCRDRRAP